MPKSRFESPSAKEKQEVDMQNIRKLAGDVIGPASKLRAMLDDPKNDISSKLAAAGKEVDHLVMVVNSLQGAMERLSRLIPELTTPSEIPRLPSIPPDADQGVMREKEK